MATYYDLNQSLSEVYNQSLKEVEPVSLSLVSVLIVWLQVMLLSSSMNYRFFPCTEFQYMAGRLCLWMLSSWMSWKFFIEYVLWGVRVLNLNSLRIGTGLLSWINTFWCNRFGFRLEFLKLAFTVRFWVVLVFAQIQSIRSLMLLRAGFMCGAQFMTLLMWKNFNYLCLQLLGPQLDAPVKWFCDGCKDFHLEFRLVIFIILLVDLDLLTSMFHHSCLNVKPALT